MFKIFSTWFGNRKEKSTNVNQLLAVLRNPFRIHSDGLRALHELLGDDDTYGRMQAFLQQVLWSCVQLQIKVRLPEGEAASMAKSLNSRFFSTLVTPPGLSTNEVISVFEFTREKIGTWLVLSTPSNLTYVGTLAAALIFPNFKVDRSPADTKLIEILGSYAAIFWQEAEKEMEQLLPPDDDDEDE